MSLCKHGKYLLFRLVRGIQTNSASSLLFVMSVYFLMKPIKLFPVIFIKLADKLNILSIEGVGLLQYKFTIEMLDFLSFMKKTSSLRALYRSGALS